VSELERAKARYAEQRESAFRIAGQNLVPLIGVQFHITGWTNKAREALATWRETGRHVDGRFDWEEIFRRYRETDRLDMAIWVGDRLAALGLGTCTGSSVLLRYLEGDPRQDCPLKGRRILIALEAAANFAQARGKNEIRVQPVNEALSNLYEGVYGFALEKPYKQDAYYRKGV
jgi:hypothetical protein